MNNGSIHFINKESKLVENRLEKAFFSANATPSEILSILKDPNATANILSSALLSDVRPYVILGLIHLNTNLTDLKKFRDSAAWSFDQWLKDLAIERIAEIEEKLAS